MYGYEDAHAIRIMRYIRTFSEESEDTKEYECYGDS